MPKTRGLRDYRIKTSQCGAELGAVRKRPMTKAAAHEISLARVFEAPPELVYRAFVDPDQEHHCRLGELVRQARLAASPIPIAAAAPQRR